MSLQTCSDVSEAVVLEESLGLYLKPVSKIKINVQLPKLKESGQSISSWNVMEKLKATVRPDQFLALKSLKITANVIKFEGELETKASAERALARLRASSSLKLSGFAEKLQLRAAHAPCTGPTRHDWEAFYRDAKGVNEMQPGERPDTIHIQDVPVRWFASSSKLTKPSEKAIRKAFITFGKIRRLEIPSNGNISSESTFGKKSSLHDDLLFEAYIQYEDYVEFSIAMDSLRGKKLLYKDADGTVYSANIKVDFDRTNYLSDRCISKRASESKKVNLASTESAKPNKSAFPSTNAPVIPNISIPLQVKVKEEKQIETKTNISTKEAKLLLKELFTRIEKTEKAKERVAELKIMSSQNPVESSKRQKHTLESKEKSKKEKLATNTSDSKEKVKKDKPFESESKEKLKTLEPSVNISESKEKLKKVKLSENASKRKEKSKNEKLYISTSESKGNSKKEKLFVTKGKLNHSYLEKKQKEKLIEQERILKEKLLRKMQQRELQKLAESREKLRKDLAGSGSLKSVLAIKKDL